MKYNVLMSATASVSTNYPVEADSPEEASRKAVEAAKAGDVSWGYDGCDDSTIEVEEVKP